MKKIIITGILISSLGMYSQTAWLTNASNSTTSFFGTSNNQSIFMRTNGSNRMTLFNTNPSNANSGSGALAIHHNPSSPITNPISLLHIGENTLSGFWPWMRVGTSCVLSSDIAYFGLKAEGADRSDAVVAWGNNNNVGGPGPDVLRFIFTDSQSELARFAPNGGNGFGNFYTYGANTQPVRRLEILDASPAPGGTSNAPQLRLTYTYNQNPLLGVFSEFQTTSNGDLYFNTRTGPSANNARSFGFHKFNPLNTVEISAQNVSPYNPLAASGSSGLRFTSLTSAKTTIPNGTNGVNSSKVLTVDSDGDVVLTDAVATTNNGISVNAGVIQLGVPCTLPGGAPNFPGLSASGLTQDRAIYLANQNFWFGNANTETGGVGVGGHPTTTGWCNTGNTFEISANSKNPQYGSTNASGLRLTKLLSTSPTVANGINGVNSTKVLTVDADGDVVLTNASNGLGNICGATPQNPLTNNWEIPMANHSYIFSGQAANDNVGIGTVCAPVAKLQVQDNTGNIATSAIGYKVTGGFISTHSNGLSTSMAAVNTSNITNSTAGYFQGNPGPKVHAIIVPPNGGLVGFGTTAPLVQLHVVDGGGVRIDNAPLRVNGAPIQVNNPTGNGVNASGNLAINGAATSNGPTNFAGYFLAAGATNNYGIYAEAPITAVQTPGSPASLTGNYAGYFNGDVVRTGTDNFTSDANLKQNIDTITNALGIINQLKPKSYEYKQNSFPSMSLPSGKQYGLIAQDVQTILPELVNNNVHPAKLDSIGNVIVPSFNYLSLEYQQLTGIIIKAMQQQQAQIKQQDSLIAALTNQINSCCSNNNAKTSSNSNQTMLNQLDVELSDKDAIVLNQNVPNPFAEQTTITYNVPVSVTKAQIIFYNSAGQIIQTVDIKTRGTGKVNVFASDLSSGLYHYTLVADGKVVDSKKMVRE